MNKIFLNNVGDLAEVQRSSFYRFLAKGIEEELLSLQNPFSAKIKAPTRLKKKSISCLVYLYTNEIKLKGPTVEIESALRRDLTYAIQLYVSGEYSYTFEKELDTLFPTSSAFTAKSKKSKISRKILKNKGNVSVAQNSVGALSNAVDKVRVKQDIFLGEIPLMTEEGTFIINGCERVIISQVIRSPGIYFQKEFGTNGKATYTATIISNKGSWTKVYLDKRLSNAKGEVGQEIGEDRIYIKLDEYKEKSVQERKYDSDNDKLFLSDFVSAFGLNFDEFRDSMKYPLQLLDQMKYSRFPQETAKRRVDIITDFLISQNNRFSLGEIGRYKVNKRLGLNLSKNVTHLTALDFVQIMDKLIELKYSSAMSEDIDHIKNKQIRSIGEFLQMQFRIGLYRLQKNISEGTEISMSQKVSFQLENPEEVADLDRWIVDPRAITCAVKEFFKTSQLSQYLDQVNPLSELTHKRRISVFGPNGLKRDHISTALRDIHPSQYGRLCPVETPEGQNAGLISSISMFGRVSSFGWIETPYFLTKNSFVFSQKQTIYLNPEQESQTTIAFSDVCLTQKNNIIGEDISGKENYSFLVKKKSEINFLTTSPLQIISLATSLIPFIEHDDANRALMGSNMQRQAVPLIFPQKPIVGTGYETAAILDSALVIKTYSEGFVIDVSSRSIIIEDLQGQRVNYYLRKNCRSNQETSINQLPIVWAGEKVFSGQIIADGPGTNDGELALGRNLTIGYMPWEGYNYEDAIVINEQVIFDDCLTSIHLEDHETSQNYTLFGNEELVKNVPGVTDHIRRHLDAEGIVKIGSYVKAGDILVGKLTPREEEDSPEARLLKAIYGEKTQTFRDTSLRVPHGTEGRVIDIRIILPNPINLANLQDESLDTFKEWQDESPQFYSKMIRISIAQIRKIRVGDKLAGRHGNKGIISRVVPRQDMPYLPDGTPVDILFNPLGVPSRMNVGQIFECLLGFAGEKLGARFKVSPFDEIYGKEASRVLVNEKLKEAAFKTNLKWVFNTYTPGKIFLRDGRTGEFFDNPTTVGKSYILKLVHLVEDKIHARSTGPYSMITEQPLAGKAQKGGQRFGEMEVWAIEAYGCSNTLQELLTIKSDDIDGRNDMYEAIIGEKRIKKPSPTIPESFLVLMRELNALGLEFSAQKVEGGFSAVGDINFSEKDVFLDLEKRLNLRALLAIKKAKGHLNGN